MSRMAFDPSDIQRLFLAGSAQGANLVQSAIDNRVREDAVRRDEADRLRRAGLDERELSYKIEDMGRRQANWASEQERLRSNWEAEQGQQRQQSDMRLRMWAAENGVDLTGGDFTPDMADPANNMLGPPVPHGQEFDLAGPGLPGAETGSLQPDRVGGELNSVFSTVARNRQRPTGGRLKEAAGIVRALQQNGLSASEIRNLSQWIPEEDLAQAVAMVTEAYDRGEDDQDIDGTKLKTVTNGLRAVYPGLSDRELTTMAAGVQSLASMGMGIPDAIKMVGTSTQEKKTQNAEERKQRMEMATRLQDAIELIDTRLKTLYERAADEVPGQGQSTTSTQIAELEKKRDRLQDQLLNAVSPEKAADAPEKAAKVEDPVKLSDEEKARMEGWVRSYVMQNKRRPTRDELKQQLDAMRNQKEPTLEDRINEQKRMQQKGGA